MLTKIETGFHAYCFAILELFDSFVGRTHAVIGIGLPMLIIVGVHTFFPRWGDLALFSLIIFPAAAAAGTMIVDFIVLSRRR